MKRYVLLGSLVMLYIIIVILHRFVYARPNDYNSNETTIGKIEAPPGFKRKEALPHSFTSWLRNIHFDKDNVVNLYNGDEKSNKKVVYKVLYFDAGTKDLQQCADAVIRLRAEYLFAQKRFDELCFRFTSGDKCCWNDYAKGIRPVFTGNRITWKQLATEDHGYQNFRKYLDLIFTYCGTASLHRDLAKVNSNEAIEPGQVFVQKGNPYGHAVMVVDVAENASGKRKFLLAQSYMPAQQIHILTNPLKVGSPWYDFPLHDLATPEWDFTIADRRSF